MTADFTAIQGHVRTEDSGMDETLQKCLRETLAKMKPRMAAMVTLRYLHDYTEQDVAKLMGVSRGSVAVTLFRVRMRLRKLLSASSQGAKR